ncbi:MAG: hypothetical protein AAGI17_06470 [Planctomycetota bacterium]
MTLHRVSNGFGQFFGQSLGQSIGQGLLHRIERRTAGFVTSIFWSAFFGAFGLLAMEAIWYGLGFEQDPWQVLLIPALLAVGAFRFQQESRRYNLRKHQCPACRYDMTGVTLDRCPECGVCRSAP